MRLLIFDPDYKGHHAGYLLHLLRQLKSRADDGLTVDLLVSEKFRTVHEDVVESAKAFGSRLRWNLMSTREADRILNTPSLLLRGLREAAIIRKAAERRQPDAILAMYLDYLLFPLALGQLRNLSVTGLIFRQNPHYWSMRFGHLPHRLRVKAFAKGLLLQRALRNPALKRCLCLDKFLTKWDGASANREKLVHCPDPVALPSTRTNGKEAFSQKTTLLLFGVVTPRKGTTRFLKALKGLDPSTLSRLAINIVGPAGSPKEEERIRRTSRKLETSACRIKRTSTFVKDADIQPYFLNCDVVVLPYLDHIGMSAILVRAAAAGKPILSTNFGLMGKLAADKHLGLTFDTGQPSSIRRAVKDFLARDFEFSTAEARSFADLNTPTAFASTIMEALSIPQSATTPLPNAARFPAHLMMPSPKS